MVVLNDIINEAATDPDLEGSSVFFKRNSSTRQLKATLQRTGSGVASEAFEVAAGSTARSFSGSFRQKKESRKISALMTLDPGDGNEGLNIKERLARAFTGAIDIFCVWDCCWAYIRLSEVRQSCHDLAGRTN